MKIDLSKLYEKSVSSMKLEGELNKDSLSINGRKINFNTPISYDGNIYIVDGDKLLYLDINYAYSEDCGRCLESYSTEKTITLSGKLVEETEENVSDEEDVIFYKNAELDLTDNIISTIILALPMKPLCDDDCEGLCPRCGVNHNKEECECVIEDIDPRLEKLKSFFSKE